MAYEQIIAGATGAAVAGFLIFWILLLVGSYVFMALAYQSIFRKSGYKRPWFAWIPILNLVPILELGKFHWAWIFLSIGAFIPIIGFFAMMVLAVISIIAHWRIFQNAGYAGALSLLLMIPIVNYILLGIVAWQKKKY